MANKFQIDENNCLVRYNGKEKVVEVPEGVVEIGKSAFYEDYNVKEITLPQSCTVIGPKAFFHCRKLKSLKIKGAVTAIGADALWGCEELEDFKIPETVTTIGSRAISIAKLKTLHIPKSVVNVDKNPFTSWGGDSTLESITVDEDSSIFSSDDGVLYNKDKTVLMIYPQKKPAVHVTLPNTVEVIGEDALKKRSDLKSVTLPNSIREIKENAFYSCENLERINLPEGLVSIGLGAFDNDKILKDIGPLPSSLKVLERMAFFNCSSIKEINIPAGIEEVGDDALDQCYGLESVILEEGVKKIDFLKCVQSLKTLHIPATVTEIKGLGSIGYITVAEENPVFSSEDGVLYSKDKTELIKYAGDKNRTTFVAPHFVKTVCKGAFKGNKTLEKIVFPEGLERIEERAFVNTQKLITVELPSTLKFLGKSAFEYCEALEYIDIPKNTEMEVEIRDNRYYGREILGNHFNRSKCLKRVTLPNTLKHIVEHMFTDCQNLVEIKLPESIETVESWAFAFCYSLKEIEIPSNCKMIGENCFSSSNLEKIVIPPSVEKIGNEAFNNVGKLTIYGEKGSYAEKYARHEKIPFMPMLAGEAQTIGDFCVQDGSITEYLGNKTDIEIPREANSIIALAFDGVKLTRVVIHKDVTDIAPSAFGRNKSFTIIGEKGSYAEKFARSKKIKFLTPEEEIALATLPEFEIKNGDLISYNSDNKNIAIPDEVTRILDGAFKLYSIDKFTFGTNVKEIGANAFAKGCKIKKVYYNGEYKDLPKGENEIRTLLEKNGSYLKDECDKYRGIIAKKTPMYVTNGMDKRLIVDRLSIETKELYALVNEVKNENKDGFVTRFSFEDGKQGFIFECSYKNFDKDILNILIEKKISMVFDDIIIGFNPYRNVKLSDFNIGTAESVEKVEQSLIDGVLKERKESVFQGVDVIPVGTKKIEPAYFDTVQGWIAEYNDSVLNWIGIEGHEDIADLVEQGVIRCKDAIVQYIKINHERPEDFNSPYFGYAHLGYKYRIRAAKASYRGNYWDFIYSVQASVFESGIFMRDSGWCEDENGGDDKYYSVYDYINFLKTEFDVEAG